MSDTKMVLLVGCAVVLAFTGLAAFGLYLRSLPIC